MVRTSGYSSFALEKLPDTGTVVDLTGVLTRYSYSDGANKTYQTLLNTSKDVVPK